MKMSALVLDTMISQMGTAQFFTFYFTVRKLVVNGVIDHLEPRVSILVSPSTTRKSFVDSEGSECSSGRFADEGHMSSCRTSRVMRHRGLLKTSLWAGEDWCQTDKSAGPLRKQPAEGFTTQEKLMTISNVNTLTAADSG